LVTPGGLIAQKAEIFALRPPGVTIALHLGLTKRDSLCSRVLGCLIFCPGR